MSTTDTSTDIHGAAVLADELSDDPPYTVHGVAIGPDEVTVGLSGLEKFWPRDSLREAADSLQGKNIVKNHVNDDVDAVVGAVQDAGFHEEMGVVYEGELDDQELAEKVNRGRLDVSPRIIHGHVDDLEEDDDGRLVVDDIREFVNLALVPQGAAESNQIAVGSSGVLCSADLQEFFSDEGSKPEDDSDELTDDPEQTEAVSEDAGTVEGEASEESGDDLEEDVTEDNGEDADPAEAGENDDAGEPNVLTELSVLGDDSKNTKIDISKIDILL